MIARLTGRVLTLDQGTLVLDVNGVGYEIEVASSTANSVEIDKIVTLETLLIVREDAQILFGFTELTDKKLFQLLIKINGVPLIRTNEHNPHKYDHIFGRPTKSHF